MSQHEPITELKMTQVADMLMEGYSQKDIARALQTSENYIRNVLAALREEWREHRMLTAEEHFDEALAKLDKLEQFIWPKAKSGYMPAVERMLQLFDQRNRLKGLYAPSKSELDVGEQLARLLSQISEEPEPEPLPLPAPQIDVIEGESTDVPMPQDTDL